MQVFLSLLALGDILCHNYDLVIWHIQGSSANLGPNYLATLSYNSKFLTQDGMVFSQGVCARQLLEWQRSAVGLNVLTLPKFTICHFRLGQMENFFQRRVHIDDIAFPVEQRDTHRCNFEESFEFSFALAQSLLCLLALGDVASIYIDVALFHNRHKPQSINRIPVRNFDLVSRGDYERLIN